MKKLVTLLALSIAASTSASLVLAQSGGPAERFSFVAAKAPARKILTGSVPVAKVRVTEDAPFAWLVEAM